MTNSRQRSVLVIGGCGYIGSRLVSHLVGGGWNVDSIDLEWFGNPAGIRSRRVDYRHLHPRQLDGYEQIILLAGHSSVRMATDDPRTAFDNNVVGFLRLLDILGDRKLIYAGSSSVYSGSGARIVDESWSTFDVGNMYDLTKYTADGLAAISGCRTYGLRFGTVNGASPNLRPDVVINAMVTAALRDGAITVFNRHIHRPILGLRDLCRAVEALLGRDGTPGAYNLSSFTTTVGAIAEDVAKILDVPIRCAADRPTYDFSMTSAKFQSDFEFEFQDSVASIVDDLLALHRAGGLRGRP